MGLFTRTYSDSELIDGIRIGDSKRAFENRLYEKYFYMIREGAWKHKLSEDECSMAYSDTILTVIDHIGSDRFENRSTLKTYVFQIFTNKCVDLIRKNSTNKQQVHHGEALEDYLNLLPDDTTNVIAKLIEQYDMDLLKSRLRETGEKCKQIILAWGEGFMDQEIAQEMGYHSAAVVKTTRLRCLEKLRALYGQGGKGFGRE